MVVLITDARVAVDKEWHERLFYKAPDALGGGKRALYVCYGETFKLGTR